MTVLERQYGLQNSDEGDPLPEPVENIASFGQ